MAKSFLDLPPELRNKVYGYLFIPPVTCNPTTTHRYIADFNLINMEASAIFYDHTSLNIHSYGFVSDYDPTTWTQLGALKYGDLAPPKDTCMIYAHTLRQLSEISITVAPIIITASDRLVVGALMIDRVAHLLDIIVPPTGLSSGEQVPRASLKFYLQDIPSGNNLTPDQIKQAGRDAVAQLDKHGIVAKLRHVHKFRRVEFRGGFFDEENLKRLHQMIAKK